MATTNPFDLLGDDDNDDPSQLIAKLPQATKKDPAPAQSAAQPVKQAKLPSKPLPPTQAVREAKNEATRGGGRGAGRGFGRGRGSGFYRDSVDNVNTFSSDNGLSGGYKPSEDGDGGKPFERRGYGYKPSEDGDGGKPFERRGYGNKPSEDGDGGKQPFERRGYGGSRGASRGGRRGGFNNGDDTEGERPRRTYERRSGTGRGNEFKRDGAGRGNWGTTTDDIAPEPEEPIKENERTENEKTVEAEKQPGQEDAGDANKENPEEKVEEKEPEEKEMTLEEYEKVLEEKRKALLALKSEERKVVVDKDFESMQLLSSKKSDDETFVKLGLDKEKRKDAAEKDEKAKKSVSINEFLKPAVGQYSPGGGRRGRGRGTRGGFGESNTYTTGAKNAPKAPSINDDGHFPTLGSK